MATATKKKINIKSKASKKAPANKKASTKKAPAKKTTETKPAKQVKWAKGEYKMINLPLGDVKLIKGFNPRSELGDVSALKSLVREHGIQQALVVRPTKTEGTYELIVGHRRYSVAKMLNLKTIPVVVRTDLTDDVSALAFAVAENAEDARTALTPLDQANSFKKIMDANPKFSATIIGKRCGCSGQHVRRMLKLLEAPKIVRERLEKGQIRSTTATAVAEMSADVQQKVIDRMEDGMTEAEVRRLGNKIAREDGVDAKANTSRNKVSDSKSTIAVARSRTEMRSMSDILLQEYFDAEDAKSAEGMTIAKKGLAVVYYVFGQIDDVDTSTSDFKKSLEAHIKEVEVVEPSKEEIKPSAKKAPAKKSPAKKKAKKKSSKK